MRTSPLIERLAALERSARIAVEDDVRAASFSSVLDRARRIAADLRARTARAASEPLGPRVAILASPGADWVEAFFGIALAGAVAVPLSPLHPPAELSFFLADSGAELLLVSHAELERARAIGSAVPIVLLADLGAAAGPSLGDADLGADRIALLLYTSGTTGRPKGAMITHDNLATQAALLREAWSWSEADVLLHALPLHHLHGLGISLLTSLLSGATARMLPRFDARRVWEAFAAGACTAWMAVPTMYQKLFEALDAASAGDRERWEAGAARLRLATSGSAALPVRLAERWRGLTGVIPLERFGMTEIGVGMSNPLDPSRRRPGSVGVPLPTVELRLVGEGGADVERGPAEAWIRGPSVFPGYHRREEATRNAFAEGGWFKTGDLVERDESGFVRILGRTSVDILKSGGYKLSALEIEEVLRDHPAIVEVAVVGVPDETWGERVVAVVVPAPGREAECASEQVRAWAKERLAPYKVPREVVVREALPRNAIGKVVKPELVKALVGSGAAVAT